MRMYTISIKIGPDIMLKSTQDFITDHRCAIST
jgi:hypothetical protein